MSEPAQPATTPRRRGPWIAGALVLVVVGAALGVRVYVGSRVRALLEERGLVCDTIDLTPRWDLSAVELGPLACLVPHERVREIGLPYGATVELDGLTPRHVVCPELTVELEGEIDLGAASGAVLAESVPEPLERAIDALAESSARTDLPSLDLEVARIRHDDHTITIRGLRTARDDDGLTIDVDRVEPPSHHGLLFEVSLDLTATHVTATPSEVHLTATFAFSSRIGPREMGRTAPLTLDGTGLDGASRSYALDIDADDALAALRAALGMLEERREAREAGAAPEPGARLGELADRLGALRERMEERTEASAPTAPIAPEPAP